jgi:regulator of nucleoside diphosphate kinase
LTHFDHHRLQGLLHVFRRRSAVNPWNLDALELELQRAHTVEAHVVPSDVITMNSKVTLQDLATGRRFSLTLVFPDAPTMDAHTVAVLSPLGLALLGNRVGQVLEFSEAGCRRELLIAKIEYQPEASGNYLM